MAVGNNISTKCKGCYRLLHHDYLCRSCIGQCNYLPHDMLKPIEWEIKLLDKNSRDYIKKDIETTRRIAKDILNNVYGRKGIGASYHHQFEIKKVIFNDPATIVMWSDGTKTVVKCQECDIFDPEKGLAMAIAKKAYGNKGRYFEQIKKWTKPYYEDIADKFNGTRSFDDFCEELNDRFNKEESGIDKFKDLISNAFKVPKSVLNDEKSKEEASAYVKILAETEKEETNEQ